MEIVIKGEFYHDLNVYKNQELIYYSKFKHRWFKGDLISVFDNENNLLVEVSESGLLNSKYLIKYQDEMLIDTIFALSSKEIIFSDNIKFEFWENRFKLFNPFAKILFNDKPVAIITMKKLKPSRHFSFCLNDFDFPELDRILIYFLLVQTSNFLE